VGYLITARHVITDRKTGRYYPRIWYRLNLLGGGTDTQERYVSDKGPEKNLAFHPDEAVELAAISVIPEENKHDFRVVGEGDLISERQLVDLDIKEGTEMFFIGLFSQFLGTRKIIQ